MSPISLIPRPEVPEPLRLRSTPLLNSLLLPGIAVPVNGDPASRHLSRSVVAVEPGCAGPVRSQHSRSVERLCVAHSKRSVEAERGYLWPWAPMAEMVEAERGYLWPWAPMAAVVGAGRGYV